MIGLPSGMKRGREAVLKKRRDPQILRFYWVRQGKGSRKKKLIIMTNT